MFSKKTHKIQFNVPEDKEMRNIRVSAALIPQSWFPLKIFYDDFIFLLLLLNELCVQSLRKQMLEVKKYLRNDYT